MENNKETPSEFKKQLKETGIFVIDILYNAVIIIVLVVLIRSFLVSPFRVVGDSMLDTLHDKEFILIDKLSYIVSDIDRGDPIVFLPPPMSSDKPKFEETTATNAEGKGTLEIEGLESDKSRNYCQNKILSHFWFCTNFPEVNDFVYLVTSQNSASETSTSNTTTKDIKPFKITEEDLQRGYLTFEGGSDQGYRVIIYDSKGPEYFVKRVIGIPGDTVKIENGRVYLKTQGDEDFAEIDTSFLNKENLLKGTIPANGENMFTVPEGHYFVMGDNRSHSTDSREWLEPITQEPTPFVPEENIAGKVMIVLWPLTAMRFIEGADF